MNQHMLLAVLVIRLLIIPMCSLAAANSTLNGIDMMLPAAGRGGSAHDKLPIIKIRHIKSLESPFPIPGVSGNSHLLYGVAPGGLCFGVSYATTYEDCTAAYYNAKLELVATWREPVAGGDKVMCMTAGDLDGDGNNGSVRNNP